MSERPYPLLANAIHDAPRVKIIGSDGQPHEVQIFPFGEYGTIIRHGLIREISHGLSKKLKRWQGQFDYLVDLMPGGGRSGLIVALDCGVYLTTGWVNRGGLLYKTMLDDEFRVKVGGPHGGELCFRGIEANDRVVILDDVIATGETMKSVIRAFKERGPIIAGVLTIVTKGDEYKRIEHDFDIPVASLMNLDERGKIIGREN
ncbi:hypothetical protein A3B51_03470 [Candidatus Curtissbacteria bacterium RIFCSPLOWO2_01_FULL_41_18]|uniref:Phosphoribosyltransferase domain-containing protein n=2 Tax=Candidatus Curtissiibacteriota TaxID=1752717 RepID=A0A1F5FXU4_9BACT|nr:MAG: hypothetical protein A2696_01585 [Candidatus Curtissbacteria bacterium RIFCSPHIGHO2_01_FULL_41_13]OGE04826.1 MAG: hypothetical protein A3B51_03470 [Candidatus Curtissbacteria bacterium RIFCSPLOWO2_01_FULL_41_18]